MVFSTTLVNIGGIQCITVSNGTVSFSVCPLRGGQLVSLKYKSPSKTSDSKEIELIDRAFEFDPPIDKSRWTGLAPVLFPAVGRQLDGQFVLNELQDVSFKMPLHGFVMDAAFEVVSTTCDDIRASVELSIDSTSTSIPINEYPFQWKLGIIYSLESDSTLNVKHVVSHIGNSFEKEVLMPFAIGNHISIAIPTLECWNSLVVKSNTLRNEAKLTPKSLLSGELIPIPSFSHENGGIFVRSHPSLTNGVFVGDGSNHTADVLLSDLSYTIPNIHIQHALELSNENLVSPLYFVFWGDNSSFPAFLCPEPWVSGPNSLNDRTSLRLPRGETASWSFRISISDPTERGNSLLDL
jgi:galactose mutarotase-like enzyme